MIVNMFDKSGTGQLSADWLKGLAGALSKQLAEDALPEFGRDAWSVIYCATPADAFAGGAELSFFKDSDQAGALGYHYEPKPGQYLATVFLDDVASNGTNAATTASHEAIEMAVDPDCALYLLGADGILRALEPGDPVEDQAYVVKGYEQYPLSNFVYRAWYLGGDGRFDHLGQLAGAYQRTAGGYDQFYIGGVATVDPPQMAQRGHKAHPTSRTARRLSLNRQTLRRFPGSPSYTVPTFGGDPTRTGDPRG